MFMKLVEQTLNKTKTENGADAVKSTGNDVINLFSRIGSLRGVGNYIDFDVLLNLFLKAYSTNKELAVKTLFYARDCRGGMGEKYVFKLLATYLLNTEYEEYENLILKNLDRIVEFGSWKDIIDIFLATTSQSAKVELAEYMKKTLIEDLKSEHPSLLAKWIPTINSKSKHTKEKAKTLVAYEVFVNNYREDIKNLRRRIGVTETLISQKRFDKIDYSKVASKCMLFYYNVFYEKDKERFTEYLDNVKKGKTKINSGVLFPSDIVSRYEKSWNRIEETLEEQWKALPNYMDKPLNCITVVDTSGSMSGTPMDVAKALGIYISERNPSEAYRNKCLEFSANVNYLDFSKYATLKDKLGAYCGEVENTDIVKVFNCILDTAIKHNLKQEEIPEYVLLLSDMQFDSGNFEEDIDDTLMESIRKVYKNNGYDLPKIIYWNLNGQYTNYPETNKDGIILVSGYSPAVLKAILNIKEFNPMSVVCGAVLIDRYKEVYWG